MHQSENAVSGENQESDQELENRFRSGGKEYLIFIIKSIGFSQSFLGNQQVVISYGKNQISADSDLLRISVKNHAYENL